MRRLVHLSDLHFGRDRPELAEPLIAAVNALAPDLVAISGDLTQRARLSQFRAARRFIDRLQAPALAVPGNHDVPLHNLLFRLVWPWRHYRRWISRDLEPQYRDDEMIVLGVNTVNILAHQSGWFTPRALARVQRIFDTAQSGQARIVVAHHPLEQLQDERKKPMRGAAAALEALAQRKTDVILTGHLHSWQAAPFAEKPGRNSVLQVQAGTGLSSRKRGTDNDFNLLEIDGTAIGVTRYAILREALDFVPVETRRFVMDAAGWKAAAPSLG